MHFEIDVNACAHKMSVFFCDKTKMLYSNQSEMESSIKTLKIF